MLVPMGSGWLISMTLPTGEVKLIDPVHAKQLAREIIYDYTVWRTLQAKREGMDEEHISEIKNSCTAGIYVD